MGSPFHRERIARQIRGQLRATKRNLESLVACNSFTRNRDGVNQVGRMIAAMFAPLGFHARFVRSMETFHGDHLFLTRPGSGDCELLLVSHLDTVYSIEEERRRDFRWREDGDTIYGPGVTDIKGGTTLMQLVIGALADVHPEMFERVTWSLMFNAAEEEGSADFPGLARAAIGPASRACLLYEHGSDSSDHGTLVTPSRRGSGRFVIEAFGRQAHAGSAHQHGASAIHEIARKVSLVESMTDPSGATTFNVGLIEGGTGGNTVPAYARCLVDLRADEPDSFRDASARICALAGEGEVASRSDGFRCSLTVTARPAYPPWPPNEGSRWLSSLAIRAGADVGIRVSHEHRLGASDGCHVWDLIPTLDGLGPVGRDLHSAEHDPSAGKTQESLRWSSVEERANLNAALITRIVEDRRS